jgi:hypothetical protein
MWDRASAGARLEATMTKETPAWCPRPSVLEKVKQYFLGFAHNDREIHARRKVIAKKLGMKVRTLDRYLHHLGKIEWMETSKRTPRTAIRTVKTSAFGGSVGGSLGGSDGASFGGSQKKENQEASSPKETHEAGTPKQHHRRDDAECFQEEQEILELAGVRKSAANLKELRESLSAFPIERVRGGVALGRLRHESSPSARPIVSFRFFASPIAEAAEVYGADQLEHTIQRLKRDLRARAEAVAPKEVA